MWLSRARKACRPIRCSSADTACNVTQSPGWRHPGFFLINAAAQPVGIRRHSRDNARPAIESRSPPMTQQTILNTTHRALGAKMVDFGGWDMPLNYGSQIEEHHAVRRDAGMFDVSHMTVVDLHGA